MRIGVDVDNTITNTFEYLLELKKKYNNDLVDDYHNWDTDTRNAFLEKYLKEIWENCTVKENCKNVIDKLRNDGHKIIIASYRQNIYGINSLELLKTYLNKNNIVVDEIYTGITKKGEFCKKHLIDLYIDDKLENLKDINNNSIDVIQFYNPFEKVGKYKVVKSWDELYKMVKGNDN